MEAKLEYRTYALDKMEVETRDDGPPTLVGHAAVFNIVEDGPGFREQIAPGAFRKSIKKDDVRALFNHDPNFVLGRNTAGTLSMKEDDRGLWVEITPPDTQFARDLMTSIKRGDISQMSFGFQIVNETRQEPDKKDDLPLFTLNEVILWDVSPVTFPFYKQTDVTLHSRQAWAERRKQEAEEAQVVEVKPRTHILRKRLKTKLIKEVSA